MADTPLPTDQHVDSRDYRVETITLISADGKYRDITGLVVELQVRQDMYLGFMSGELVMNDGVDMHSQAALHGGEYLLLHLTEPEQEVCIRKAFRIYKVADRSSAQNNSQRYIIYFVSDEMFKSNQVKITKAYVATTVSDIASDIMQNYLDVPSNRMVIDPTSDPVDIIIPNYRPFEALNWLASRAFSSTDNCWFFYENLNGFNFRSLHSIYKDGTVIKVPFKFEQKGGEKDIGMDKYAIDSFEVKRDFDVLKTLSTGGYALQMQGLDLFTQSVKVTEYGMDDLKFLNKNPSMTNPKQGGKALFDRHEAYNLTYLDGDKDYTSSWIKRIMHMAALNNNVMEMVVPGSVRLQAGTLMNIRFPYASTPADGDIWDKRKSGRYLIAAVNHKFDLVDHKFDTIVLLTRDSDKEALPTYDNTLPDKITKINSNSHRA